MRGEVVTLHDSGFITWCSEKTDGLRKGSDKSKSNEALYDLILSPPGERRGTMYRSRYKLSLANKVR